MTQGKNGVTNAPASQEMHLVPGILSKETGALGMERLFLRFKLLQRTYSWPPTAAAIVVSSG
jgi:hypothetical protein